MMFLGRFSLMILYAVLNGHPKGFVWGILSVYIGSTKRGAFRIVLT